MIISQHLEKVYKVFDYIAVIAIIFWVSTGQF